MLRVLQTISEEYLPSQPSTAIRTSFILITSVIYLGQIFYCGRILPVLPMYSLFKNGKQVISLSLRTRQLPPKANVWTLTSERSHDVRTVYQPRVISTLSLISFIMAAKRTVDIIKRTKSFQLLYNDE